MTPGEIEAELAQLRTDGKKNERVVEVWPEHYDVWDTWCVMANHWRVVAGIGGGARLGLHLPSLPIALDIAGVKKRRRRIVMRALRYMEGQALAVLNAGEDEG
jgi:hypothetical protein